MQRRNALRSGRSVIRATSRAIFSQCAPKVVHHLKLKSPVAHHSVHPSRRHGPARYHSYLQHRGIFHSNASRFRSIHRRHPGWLISSSLQGHSIVFSRPQSRDCHRFFYNITGPVSRIVGLGQQFKRSGRHIDPCPSRSSAAGGFKGNTKETWNASCPIPPLLRVGIHSLFRIECSRLSRIASHPINTDWIDVGSTFHLRWCLPADARRSMPFPAQG